MHQKRFVLCTAAAALAVAIACSKSTETPTSPSVSENGTSSAGPDGSTLKVTAPSIVSPTNGAQPDSLTLTAGKAEGKYDKTLQLSYQFQVLTDGGEPISACTQNVTPDSGAANVTYSPSCAIEFDAPHKWRVRARQGDFVGPWSATASFKSPSGGYIRGNEVFDPLTNGKTAGELNGPTQFIPGEGLKLLDHVSFVRYRLPVNLQAGEFSMMIKGADEGTEGDKSKVFAMQEGPDEGDITDDDYRMTAELRGANYGAPGAVTFRIIPGDGDSNDGERHQINFNSTRWYFWKFVWQTGFARLEVREDGPNGRVLYNVGTGMGPHPYRPDPHYIYLGAPMGRAGALDATLPGGIYKNVWASSRPRPNFPGE
ncbi:MAG TPA: hypothetical protein VL882_12265 [Vicinamibacterales bacterium]|jgi:hypothetical protein|nr:hypothetical protein [Vicinamibacterales bacterium]